MLGHQPAVEYHSEVKKKPDRSRDQFNYAIEKEFKTEKKGSRNLPIKSRQNSQREMQGNSADRSGFYEKNVIPESRIETRKTAALSSNA